MDFSFTETSKTLDTFLKNGIAENYALRVAVKDKVLFSVCSPAVNRHTLFDMASVTKILATTTLSLIAFDEGILSPDKKVSDFFKTNEALKDITIRNLLTHTIGIGYVNLCREGVSYTNIAEYILHLTPEKEVGRSVFYSCPAFIVLGKILEKIYSKRLDVLFREKVAVPLGMRTASFLPEDRHNAVNSNLDESERGIVNDNNCKYLGGICGNAGIFACLEDLIPFVDMLTSGGAPLIRKTTFGDAVRNQTPGLNDARGLGFVYVDEKYQQTADLFPVGSFGHCGHTGQSIFADPNSGLNVIFLSDATITVRKNSVNASYDVIRRMREEIHHAIKVDINQHGVII